MGLDSIGAKIYDIHGYFHGLKIGQWTPGFWGVTNKVTKMGIPRTFIIFKGQGIE